MTLHFVPRMPSIHTNTRSGLQHISVLLLIALFLTGCNLARPASAFDPADTTAPALPTPTAQPESVTTTPTTSAPSDQPDLEDDSGPWRYAAQVQAMEEITIVAEVAGRVLEMNVNEGDIVRAGQPLFRLDSTLLEAERAHALAALQAAQAQVELLQLPASDAEIEAARAQVALAEAVYQRALNGPNPDEVREAEARRFQAEAALRRAQAAYDQLAWNPLITSMPESAALDEAKRAFEEAQAAYDDLVKTATEEEIAKAYADLAAARAQLQRLEDGPEAAQIEAALAQVKEAETALYLAQLQLEKAAVRAPRDGVVAQLHLTVGSTAMPGSAVLMLYSPEIKLVFPVEERRMGQLHLGQEVQILVDAYPGQNFAGTISTIAPFVNPETGRVSVTVRPRDENPPFTPGMSATVEIER